MQALTIIETKKLPTLFFVNHKAVKLFYLRILLIISNKNPKILNMPSKSEFICTICKIILLEPIEYKCECSKTTRICNEHISMHCPNSFKRKKISIECVNCGEQIIHTSFVKAEHLQAQIENYGYLSNGEILLKKLPRADRARRC